jgi:phospholipid-binding lipoprotein MlaA
MSEGLQMRMAVVLAGVERRAVVVLGVMAVLLLSACASGANAVASDPLEPMNRQIYRLNDAVDTAVAKPLANIYGALAPEVVRTGVDNFFGNLGDAWSAVNAVLQAKPRAALENLLRFSVNTVFGVGGVLDVASDMGIERSRKDFGQTLGRWGVPPGPYVVIPFLGPSSARDGVALLVDSEGDIVRQMPHVGARNSLLATRLIDKRAGLFKAEKLLDSAALDKYSFTRDAYLQYRQAKIEAAQEPEEEVALP